MRLQVARLERGSSASARCAAAPASARGKPPAVCAQTAWRRAGAGSARERGAASASGTGAAGGAAWRAAFEREREAPRARARVAQLRACAGAGLRSAAGSREKKLQRRRPPRGEERRSGQGCWGMAAPRHGRREQRAERCVARAASPVRSQEGGPSASTGVAGEAPPPAGGRRGGRGGASRARSRPSALRSVPPPRWRARPARHARRAPPRRPPAAGR